MKKWYVVQVVSSSEDSFRRDLLKMISESNMSEEIADVLVPVRKKNSEDPDGEKAFPGYVFVCAEMCDAVANFIAKVPRFSKFVGGMPPVPLREKEVSNILDDSGKLIKAADSAILIGGEVKIIKGPFSGFVGFVEGVDNEGQKVRLSVSIFGRMTSISVDADQLEA